MIADIHNTVSNLDDNLEIHSSTTPSLATLLNFPVTCSSWFDCLPPGSRNHGPYLKRHWDALSTRDRRHAILAAPRAALRPIQVISPIRQPRRPGATTIRRRAFQRRRRQIIAQIKRTYTRKLGSS